MIIIEPIAEIRSYIDQRHGGNQSEFARATGFSPTYVSDVLSGRRLPSERLLSFVGLQRAVVRMPEPAKPIKVSEAELSVRTSVTARRAWGDDMLLSELIAKTDEEIKAAGMTCKSIKEIREIAECMA